MPSIQEAAELPPLKPISSKSVLIAEPDNISPGTSPTAIPADRKISSRGSFPSKQHRTSTSKRLSGRPAPDNPSPSLHSISSIGSVESDTALDPADHENQLGRETRYHDARRQGPARQVLSQVAEWLHQEKARKAAHKTRRDGHAKLAHAAEASRNLVDQFRSDESRVNKERHVRTSSDVSEGTLALEKLEQILSKSVGLGDGPNPIPVEDRKDSYFPRRKSKRQGSGRGLLRKASAIASSDTEYQEPDIDVPSAEVVLDNSKTLGYSGRQADSEVAPVNPNKRAVKEKEAWLQFKMEIVRLSHTLRLRGWRRIPLDRGGDIDVERLSGALTNAVYVVSPPKDHFQSLSTARDSTFSVVPKKPPPKLLLRIYGPQVEHLIDRESELQILRRLARKKIGPRLLGTFTNGRFEQFFHARTLTARDLRVPETSKQIAKRMRELHDGIDLLEEEREEGAFIWRNWNKWVDRCEEVISWLDDQILSTTQGAKAHFSGQWRERGLVCGVEWSFFRRTVEKYRKWLFDQYGGSAGVRQKLVFAHNDTQYGNLLRLEPSGESPLLLPANEHKQLIVIDFEYASANLPGLEFANHFTEWCYDYHSSKPYALNVNKYPTPEEQHRFLKAYVQHRPRAKARSSMSPFEASLGPSSSISTFMLDSRAPMAQIEEEKRQDEAVECEVKELVTETRLWRIANSAQWVAWGIVQAKVPGMNEALEARKCATPKSEDTIIQTPQAHLDSEPLSQESRKSAQDAQDRGPEGREETTEEGHGEVEEFDYLGYAQERAMFFWGDVLQLGIVKNEDLSEELRNKVKTVKY